VSPTRATLGAFVLWLGGFSRTPAETAVETPAPSQADAEADQASRLESLRRAFLEHDEAMLVRDPTLVAGKYARMAKSPFAFFRGTAWLRPREPSAFETDAASHVAVMGDPHPENVATYPGTDGRLLLQFNDFDLAGFGPYVDDLRRMALGLWITADMAGLGRNQREKVVAAAVDGYLSGLRKLSTGGPGFESATDVFRGRVDEVLAGTDDDADALRPASTAEAAVARDIVASGVAGEHQASWKVVIPAGRRAVAQKSFFAIKRIGRRDAGVASFPVLRLRVVLEGPTAAANDDVTLELKESSGQAARTIVAIQREFSPATRLDPFLGWTAVGGREFRSRRVLTKEARLSVNRIAKAIRAGRFGKKDLRSLAVLMGRLLAAGHGTAHDRAGKPGLPAITAAITSEEGFRRETLAYVERSARAGDSAFHLFRELLADRGPLLGWTGPSR
jgi:hypothetical protein